MNTITDSPVIIQTSPRSVPSTPSWFGEVVVIAHALRRMGVLAKISQQVRFTRRRFGRYEVIDFLAVLFGYAVSGERTLEAFYERLHPFATAFMAFFGRDHLPVRSTLSRFLAALTSEPVEALRTLFLEDLCQRERDFEQQPCGLTDRAGNQTVSYPSSSAVWVMWISVSYASTGFLMPANSCTNPRGRKRPYLRDIFYLLLSLAAM